MTQVTLPHDYNYYFPPDPAPDRYDELHAHARALVFANPLEEDEYTFIAVRYYGNYRFLNSSGVNILPDGSFGKYGSCQGLWFCMGLSSLL